MIEVKIDWYISHLLEMYLQYGYSDGKFLSDWLNEYIGHGYWFHNRRLNALYFYEKSHVMAFKLVFPEYCI